MTKTEKIRRRLIKVYGKHYKRANVDLDKCFYCNEPRQCLDHVPPITYIEGYNIHEFKKQGYELLLYPSCIECNNILGDRHIIDPVERLEYLSERYSNRLDKIEVWTEHELDEMGYNMKTYILGKGSRLNLWMKKDQAVLDKIDLLLWGDEYD